MELQIYVEDKEQQEIEKILNNRTKEDKEVAFSKIVEIGNIYK